MTTSFKQVYLANNRKITVNFNQGLDGKWFAQTKEDPYWSFESTNLTELFETVQTAVERYQVTDTRTFLTE